MHPEKMIQGRPPPRGVWTGRLPDKLTGPFHPEIVVYGMLCAVYLSTATNFEVDDAKFLGSYVLG